MLTNVRATTDSPTSYEGSNKSRKVMSREERYDLIASIAASLAGRPQSADTLDSSEVFYEQDNELDFNNILFQDY
jgi:hypothetical protein